MQFSDFRLELSLVRTSNSSNSPVKYKSTFGWSTTVGLNSSKMVNGALVGNNDNPPIVEEDNSEKEMPKNTMFRLEEYKESQEYSSSSEENIIDFGVDSSYFRQSTPWFEEENPFEMTVIKLDKIEVIDIFIVPYLINSIFHIPIGAYIIIVI